MIFKINGDFKVNLELNNAVLLTVGAAICRPQKTDIYKRADTIRPYVTYIASDITPSNSILSFL